MVCMGWDLTGMKLLIIFSCCLTFYRSSAAATKIHPTIELAKSAGFPVEEHRTVTKDGYLIVLHRIPPLASIREQRVVIYIHGLFASSLDMVIRGRKMGFGYQLSEAGFDVWLPNLRGSTDNPITVNVTKNNPWDFSWDENARYDFPAIMDYVLAVTGTRKVSTIGMSMAANVVLGGVALRPHYNQRLDCMVFFAPTARMKYTTSFVRFAAPHWRWFQKIAEIYRIYKIPNMNNELFHRLMSWLCSLRNIGLFFCTSIIFSAESNMFQIDKELVPTLFKYYPHPGSTKTVIHYFQMANSGRFSAFDYGPEQNVLKYNHTVPMDYDLSKVTAPAAIFYSKWDAMVNYQDAEWLASQLNTILAYSVPKPNFAHLSFQYDPNLKNLVHNRVVNLLLSL